MVWFLVFHPSLTLLASGWHSINGQLNIFVHCRLVFLLESLPRDCILQFLMGECLC
jgi:hypothetical protein